MSVCLFVCLFACVTLKTIAMIDLLCLHNMGYIRGSVPISHDPDRDSTFYSRIFHHCEIGLNATSKYVMMSKRPYDEKNA